MALIVQKYGGSSVRTAEHIKRVAERVVATRGQGHDVVVIVSAMGDTTDRLLDLARQVTDLPSPRELDMLLTAGERIANALTAMAIHTLGAEACSLSGPQAGVLTTPAYGKAQIVDVAPRRVRQALDRGMIVLVAGFQGINPETGDITTLGRGGSDTTAIALAAVLKADVCEICTDVDGVYTADPRIVPEARRLEHITYEAMQEMAAGGAKVLAPRSVEYARRCGVPVHVRSSFHTGPGTMVSGSAEDVPTEHGAITGVAHDVSGTKVTVTGVPDRPGTVARIFRAVADAGCEVDMALQNVPSPADGRTDVTFLLPKDSGLAATAALRKVRAETGFAEVHQDDDVAKVSLIGSGMRAHPGVTAAFCEALAGAGVNIEVMSTSEIRISAVCRTARLSEAIRALHGAFGLDTGEGETEGEAATSG
ncbi:aspartate kinase [Streptomyces roseoverticillatus]|uniref:aspartate kinase n=1 Tax=Streptomyces roseoverticillatus TaxID=66429 RepID=UPI0005B823CB|nr:aspartate kinase [Streptomyces roseoverticillatus]